MTAEPQPSAAAILDTLNEIKRELAESRIDRSSPSITVRPIKIVGESSEATPASTPRVEVAPRAERGPLPPRRSTARRIALGIVVACAYVGIFAVAGIFVSRAVRPHGDGAASVTATAERVVAAIAARADAVMAGWRGTGAPAPADEAPLAVARPARPAVMPPAAPRAPGAATNASAAASPAALPAPRAEASPPIAPRAEASPPTAPHAEALSPIVAPPPVAAALHAVSPPSAPAAPPMPTVGSPRADAAAPSAPPDVAASPAPAAAVATPAQDLRLRGDQRLSEGDVASARLFYQRAAEAGDARAALQLGGTYDPAFLTHLGVQGMRGDVREAASWYRRALALGDAAAERRLQALPAQ
ncbi:MAG TPA: hypothetical protein VMU87_21520 [Stellaceae bacterium]|nr:hypothetical protein [Stellaceae bacterium]